MGLPYQNPAEITMFRPHQFWDRFAERYSKQPVADEESYQRKLKVTREYFRPDMEVFEFGCGTGSTAIAHAPYVKHIHAIDISSKMIAIAQRKADTANITNVTFERAGIDAFEPPDTRYDLVMAHSILHLLHDKDAAIAKVERMLKPGGFFVSSTVCAGDTMRYLRFVAFIGRVFGLVLKVFTGKELMDSIIKGGFEIDHHWRPGEGKAVFIVAKKAGA